ncbi:hypothetical protein GCM10009802_58500 [Streptomyces synnematoformans]|uniref:Uncharacterized protein n=1 Tax=Streptomyces synnematoformans TaxID=415721 RepID=A0ABN1ZP19_9ACTN
MVLQPVGSYGAAERSGDPGISRGRGVRPCPVGGGAPAALGSVTAYGHGTPHREERLALHHPAARGPRTRRRTTAGRPDTPLGCPAGRPLPTRCRRRLATGLPRARRA